MGNEVGSEDKRSLTEVTITLLKRAGYSVILPQKLPSLCCGMPYDSKGMNDIADQKSQELQAALWQASQEGKIPVLMDTSPCSKLSKEKFEQSMEIHERPDLS